MAGTLEPLDHGRGQEPASARIAAVEVRRGGLAGLSGIEIPDDHEAAMEAVRRAVEESLVE
jgi:hypothetical protein